MLIIFVYPHVSILIYISYVSALVQSLTMGTTFLMSPVAGVLTDTIGLRTTTFIGGAIASGGMLISSFCDHNVVALYITYGIMYGLGGSLVYTPSLAILGHYFKKHIGVVNGVVTAGSSTFTIVVSYLMDWLLRKVRLAWTFRVLALFAASMMGCALVFKPRIKNTSSAKKKKATFRDTFNVTIWKNKKFVLWVLLVPLSLFGYFVPYVHMLRYVQDNYPPGTDGKLPVSCIGITSFLGRLLFGYISDHPKVNSILLQQMAFFSIAILTMLIPSTSGHFAWLIVIVLFIGFFDGCFISLLGPIAFQLCGQEGATQAIGFLLGLCSVPLTAGPYFAGLMYDYTRSYTMAFILSGIPLIISAIAMFLIRLVDKKTSIPDKGDYHLRDPLNLHEMRLEKVSHPFDISQDRMLRSTGRLFSRSARSRCLCYASYETNHTCKSQRYYSYSLL